MAARRARAARRVRQGPADPDLGQDVPRDGLDGHALAEHMFDRVLAYMGASDLALRLVPDEMASRYEATSTHLYAPQWRSMASGTYSSTHGDITYDVNLLKRPIALVAVLSHEIAHAVVDEGASTAPPSDPEFDELLTDFASVMSGFGLFQIAYRQPSNPRTPESVQAAARYYTYYMNRREACTATALFALLHGIEPKLVLRAADMDARGGLKHAFKDLKAHRARIEAIARIKQKG